MEADAIAVLKEAYSKLVLIPALLLSVFPAQQAALAQQTIYNVPSASITPENRLFLEQESEFKFWRPARFVNNTEYAAVGIGRHTELDVRLFNVRSPASGNIALGAGFKSAIPLLKKSLSERELKLTVGSMVPVSLEGHGVGNWSYSHLSARVPRLNTRLSAGVSVGTRQIFGRNAVSFIGGVEQPVNKRLNLLAGWFSGRNTMGFLTTGISVNLPKDAILYAGYQIPNNPENGSHGLVLELSKLLF